jgi:hypothetical protein
VPAKLFVDPFQRLGGAPAPSTARDLLSQLQHPIDLIEVQTAEQGRQYSLNAKHNLRRQSLVIGGASYTSRFRLAGGGEAEE